MDKKSKKVSSLSVGDTPYMTPGSLENASMTTWNNILNDTGNYSKERTGLGEEFKMQIVGPLATVGVKWEDFRKRHATFVEKLTEDREKSYIELKAVQKRYFDQCQHVERTRQKSSQGGADKVKYNQQMKQNMSDMNNAKNTYIIAIKVANAHKKKYYYQDIPDVLDSLQDLNEIRVQKLNSLWTKAAALEKACSSRQIGHLESTIASIAQNNPMLDSGMFAQHNMAPWQETPDFQFEACPIWHDTADLAVDESSQIFLQNKIAKSRAASSDLQVTIVNKKREIDNLSKLKAACMADPQKGNIDELINNLIEAKREIAFLDNTRLTLQTEISSVVQVVGDIDVGLSPHAFKSASFAIPTTCDFCGGTIWGLNSKGYTCKGCSYTCHKNCQMKVPSNCTGVKGEKKSATKTNGNADGVDLKRSDTVGSITDSVYGISTTRTTASNGSGDPEATTTSPVRGGGRIVEATSSSPSSSSAKVTSPTRKNLAPPPAAFVKVSPVVLSTRAIYSYEAASSAELTIKEGDSVTVLEEDDGSGWIKVKTNGSEGLVPATYVENPRIQQAQQSSPPVARPSALERKTSVSPNDSRPSSVISSDSSCTKKKGPPVLPKKGGKKLKQVRALYDYTAQTEVELTIKEGDIILLVGEDTGDGTIDIGLSNANL